MISFKTSGSILSFTSPICLPVLLSAIDALLVTVNTRRAGCNRLPPTGAQGSVIRRVLTHGVSAQARAITRKNNLSLYKLSDCDHTISPQIIIAARGAVGFRAAGL